MEKPKRSRKTGCVVLAAGAGSRFGGDKLSAEFDGKKLYERALDALPQKELFQVAVVSGREEILKTARLRGYLTVRNDLPEEGISRSIRLGMDALPGCDALLFLVADQPLLKRETVHRILRSGEENPEKIIAPVRPDGQAGNPCLFPAKYFDELRALDGDRGGRRVISRHSEALLTVDADPIELYDTDSREALDDLAKRAQR